MNIHIELAPQYEFLRQYIEEIPAKFNSLGVTIHKARNIIHVDKAKNVRLVIKSYQGIYLFNRFVYANLLPSKAKRAFKYARLLIDKGFRIPEPVAYIECVDNLMMKESYFISTYTDYRPLKDILDMPGDEARAVLSSLAKYTYQLHQNNIFHQDYSIGNILFKQDGDAYAFTLIDNNRMTFGAHSFDYRMKNLRRLDLPLTMLAYLCQHYAQVSGENELFALSALLNYRKQRSMRIYRKERMKQAFRRLLIPAYR
jgi:RIO-like serine/threonine protein kinase